MNDVLLRPIFRKKYLDQQKSNNKFNKGGIANIQKFQAGGLSVGERRALKLAPFVSALLGAQQKPGEGELSSVANAFSKGFAAYPDVLKTIAAIDQAEAEKAANSPAAQAAKQKQELEKEFRNTWRQSKVVKNFEDAQAGYARVVKGANQESKAGDIALVFGYMKTLDPTSVVRESEFSLAENVGSFGEKFQAYYDSIKGRGRLTPKMRREILASATEQFSTYQIELDTFKQDLRRKSENLNIDPGKIEFTADRRPKQVTLNGENVVVPLGTRLVRTSFSPQTGKLMFYYKFPNPISGLQGFAVPAEEVEF